MTTIERIEKQYETGHPIFCKFFELNSKDMKKKLQEMFDDKRIVDVIENGTITKTLKDDIPYNIEINYYARIEISFLGIEFFPEHYGSKMLVEFTSNFIF